MEPNIRLATNYLPACHKLPVEVIVEEENVDIEIAFLTEDDVHTIVVALCCDLSQHKPEPPWYEVLCSTCVKGEHVGYATWASFRRRVDAVEYVSRFGHGIIHKVEG